MNKSKFLTLTSYGFSALEYWLTHMPSGTGIPLNELTTQTRSQHAAIIRNRLAQRSEKYFSLPEPVMESISEEVTDLLYTTKMLAAGTQVPGRLQLYNQSQAFVEGVYSSFVRPICQQRLIGVFEGSRMSSEIKEGVVSYFEGSLSKQQLQLQLRKNADKEPVLRAAEMIDSYETLKHAFSHSVRARRLKNKTHIAAVTKERTALGDIVRTFIGAHSLTQRADFIYQLHLTNKSLSSTLLEARGYNLPSWFNTEYIAGDTFFAVPKEQVTQDKKIYKQQTHPYLKVVNW